MQYRRYIDKSISKSVAVVMPYLALASADSRNSAMPRQLASNSQSVHPNGRDSGCEHLLRYTYLLLIPSHGKAQGLSKTQGIPSLFLPDSSPGHPDVRGRRGGRWPRSTRRWSPPTFQISLASPTCPPPSIRPRCAMYLPCCQVAGVLNRGVGLKLSPGV